MTSQLGRLRGADGPAAAAYFAEVDPEALVAVFQATGDEELLEILDRDPVLTAAVRGLLARLHEYALPDRVRAVSGDVRFEVLRKGKLLAAGTIRIADGRVDLLADGSDADVVLRTGTLEFLRIVSGECNAGLAYLSGKLDIEGDADLALAVGGLFRVPGTDAVAVDPRVLDPVDVATALGRVKGDHLKKVMRSGFRPVVLGEIFRRLPDFVDGQRAAKVSLRIGFRLTGNPSGDVERYLVVVDGGRAVVSPGEEGGERDATVTCEGHDFLRLATGHLNPVFGVLRGQLKVKGDQARALQLSSVIDIPRAP